MNADEQFMRLALAEAARGRGAVEPNPMVGAVIVRDGVEIARGRHGRFGGPHAEVEAVAAARAAGRDIRGATIYVTLEPCCHFGKTPPCADLLIREGIGRVVAAMVDPDARVAGKGLAALKAAGIDTAVGVCEADARKLLAAYTKLRTKGRPWVICKWAQTADGYLALPPAAGRWISCEASRQHAHVLRAMCSGVAVGVGTVLIDDPLLTNRTGAGRQPVRLVLDSLLRTPPEGKLAQSARELPVLIAASAEAVAGPAAEACARLADAGVEILPLPADAGGVDLEPLLDELGRRQWTYLLVEGGPGVLRTFLRAGLVDELAVFTCPQRLAPQDAAGLPHFDVADVLAGGQWQLEETLPFGGDLFRRWILAPR